jgi:hypothetical protein
MTRELSVLLLLLSSSCLVSALSRVYLTQDGGYKGIVVRIDKDVDQDHCYEILKNVKVRIVNLSINCVYLYLSGCVHCWICCPAHGSLWPSIFLPHHNCCSSVLVNRNM